MRRGGWAPIILVLLALLIAPLLACNLAQPNNATPADQPSSAPSTATGDMSPPTVVIQSPPPGSQAVVGKDLSVKVHATDSIGLTRVEMRESGRIVASQFSPDSSRDFTTVLTYRPSSVGALTLEVIAFRQNVASGPATVGIDVVGSEADLANPSSLDPTSGVAGGPICTVHPTTALSLRAGPGTNYRLLATLKTGEALSVIGRNAESSWYQVKRSDTTVGWVSVSFTTADGDCGKAPVTIPAP